MTTTTTTPSPIIEHRTEAIALVALTRVPEVNPKRVGIGDIDFFAFIPGEDPEDGFRFFGVVVQGMQKHGSTEAANLWAGKTAKALQFRDAFYAFPTIVLLCSIIDESVYYSWLMEPSVERGSPRLKKIRTPRFEAFDADALRNVVNSVSEWYKVAVEDAE